MGIQFTSCSLKPKCVTPCWINAIHQLEAEGAFSTGFIVSTCFWNIFMCFHMLFFKVQILSYCCSGDEYLWRENLPLLHNAKGGSGAGDVFPSWNEGRKTSRVSCWHHLVQGSLHCLSSSPSWFCSAFSTSLRKVEFFECMGNNSSTHWCQKYKLIPGGKNVLHHGSFFGQVDLLWDEAAFTLPPLC